MLKSIVPWNYIPWEKYGTMLPLVVSYPCSRVSIKDRSHRPFCLETKLPILNEEIKPVAKK